ncbi:MAG: helix-turn-helix domain-containing protein [Actinobacteria bacterium]|nr:helix-turn-helix domain-containing protein [Actinomycetota bacterium]
MSTQEGKISRKRWFAQVPDDLVTDKRLSSNAVRVWIRLDKYAGRGQDGSAMPSRGKLAADLDMSERSVSRALSELVAAGWITRRRIGQTNVWETLLNDQARAISGASGSKERDTGAPETGHGRPGNGTRLARPRKDRRDRGDIDPAPTGADGAEELDLGIAPAGPQDHAGMLVAAYVDALKDGGGIPTKSMRGAIGANVKRLLRDDPNIELPVILRAVQIAGAKRARVIDPFLGEVQASYSGREAVRKAMFTAWEQHAARFDGRRS